MADLFRSLSCLVEPITNLFNAIMITGHLPYLVLFLHVILLDKPNRDTELCKSKRPISLISVLSKALETVVLNGLIAKLEDQLTAAHVALRSTCQN